MKPLGIILIALLMLITLTGVVVADQSTSPTMGSSLDFAKGSHWGYTGSWGYSGYTGSSGHSGYTVPPYYQQLHWNDVYNWMATNGPGYGGWGHLHW